MDVMFQSHPNVTIATNTFVNCKTILQYEDVPLIEVGQFESAGYTTRFSVFHNDGTKIAVVKGSQLYLTEEGKKAIIKPRFEPGLTACELDGKTIFELRREGPAALKGWAELYAPEGVFIKAIDSDLFGLTRDNTPLQVRGLTMMGNTITARIGIHVTQEGIAVGVA